MKKNMLVMSVLGASLVASDVSGQTGVTVLPTRESHAWEPIVVTVSMPADAEEKWPSVDVSIDYSDEGTRTRSLGSSSVLLKGTTEQSRWRSYLILNYVPETANRPTRIVVSSAGRTFELDLQQPRQGDSPFSDLARKHACLSQPPDNIDCLSAIPLKDLQRLNTTLMSHRLAHHTKLLIELGELSSVYEDLRSGKRDMAAFASISRALEHVSTPLANVIDLSSAIGTQQIEY